MTTGENVLEHKRSEIWHSFTVELAFNFNDWVTQNHEHCSFESRLLPANQPPASEEEQGEMKSQLFQTFEHRTARQLALRAHRANNR